MTRPAPLTDLLGDTRARILGRIQQGRVTAGDLAEDLGVSAAAVRRHLTSMEADGLIAATTVHDGGMGRPADHWALTTRGRRLFTDRSADFADDLLSHVEETYGRAAVAEFLKRRNERQAAVLAQDLAAVADPVERARLLAEALSANGFAARVESGGDHRSLTLLQSHCAIEGIAREHPEICAHEAAMFKRVLGTPDLNVRISRRETIASGSHACVCHVEVPDHQTDSSTSDKSPQEH